MILGVYFLFLYGTSTNMQKVAIKGTTMKITNNFKYPGQTRMMWTKCETDDPDDPT